MGSEVREDSKSAKRCGSQYTCQRLWRRKGGGEKKKKKNRAREKDRRCPFATILERKKRTPPERSGKRRGTPGAVGSPTLRRIRKHRPDQKARRRADSGGIDRIFEKGEELGRWTLPLKERVSKLRELMREGEKREQKLTSLKEGPWGAQL